MIRFTKDISFEKNYPFTIFKIDNFLDKDLYENLRLNFPPLPNEELTDNKNMKLSFSDISQNYKKLIHNQIYFKQLNDIIYSEEFFSFFFKSLFIKIIKARSSNIFELLKICRLPVSVKNLDENFSFLKKFFYNKIKISVQISYIKNNGFILPHVDNKSKLLSMMIYFPETDKREEKDLGTNFYSYKKPNFINKHIDGSDLENFKENSELIYKSRFDKNNLYGFVKNNFSWHSVSQVNLKKEYIRKSININFYF